MYQFMKNSYARLVCVCRPMKRLGQIHHDNLLSRLERIEAMMERLEKRLWFTVYGVVAVILAQAVQSFLVVTP